MGATKQLLEAIQQTQADTQQAIDLCDGLTRVWAIGGDAVDAFLAMVEGGTPAARAAVEVELDALDADYQAMTAAERAAIYPSTEQRAEAQEADMRGEATITTIPAKAA